MNKPKLNKSAYYYFCHHMKPIVCAKFNNIHDQDAMRILKCLWEKLEKYEKQVYIDMADDDKKRYEFETSFITE
jgi:hypothetical protein